MLAQLQLRPAQNHFPLKTRGFGQAKDPRAGLRDIFAVGDMINPSMQG